MKTSSLYLMAIALLFFYSCENSTENTEVDNETPDVIEVEAPFQRISESFADIQILRYQINGFDKLSLKQKKLVYYLYQAGLSGRDIIWDQNYRHNLEIRNALEHIVANFDGDRDTEEWKQFMIYTKRVWFANGIHHHYSMDKFRPGFSHAYFDSLVASTGTELDLNVVEVLFNEADNKRVSLDPEHDLILASANNFYQEDISEEDVNAFYEKIIDKADTTPVEYGLNSKLVKNDDGVISESVFKVGGMYNDALVEVVKWLKLAQGVAENDAQGDAIGLLIEYYETGDLEKWSEYNVAWCQATEGDIDYIQGFVEVYGDAVGMRGTYESIVQIKDFESSARMKVLADNAQWFEDHSSIMDKHKKDSVVGVTYNVVNVAGEAGDASPSTPIGVNLPNSSWIRKNIGSKSVSLGNIVEAYDDAGGEGILNEFAHDQEEIDRSVAHAKLAAKLHTAMHEVIGHASGQLDEGVTKKMLENYASTLEEARADLVALYYLLDEKLVNLKLMESLEVGKAEYDSYIRNGLIVQLRRLESGADIEEAHMRNRQLVAAWAYEKGQDNNIIEKVIREDKTYYEIHDYQALRVIFGDLLREIQRIISEGDYKSGKALVEDYGVKVDLDLHNEILDRSNGLNIPPYNGFINPVLKPVTDADGNITDIKIKQPKSLEEQMFYYAKTYGFLSKQK